MRRIPLSRLAGLVSRRAFAAPLAVALACGHANAADPIAAPKPATKAAPKPAAKGEIIPVQARPPEPEPERPEPTSTTPPTQQQPVTTTPMPTPAATPTGAAPGASVAEAAAARPTQTQTDTASNVVSGAEATTRNATDVGSLLGRSLSDPGVFIQQRNPIMTDPRLRSYGVGLVNTQADGGWWMPARPDLDTVVSKYDASNIQDIIVVKGPYAVHYGPGFAFLDIVTNPTPRYQCGTEFHSQSFLGYQTNGQRWDGRETVYGGGSNWGMRIGWGIRTGNDYTAGNGMEIPASYNSQDLNFALGYDFSPDSKIEFKGLRLSQKNLQFPGLYFDITKLTTDAYTLRYQLSNQDYFDRFAADVWYNRTGAEGNTLQGAKQVFLSDFLDSAILGNSVQGIPPFPNSLIQDLSSTHFSESSKGYRIATTWGQPGNIQVSLGNDLNYANQFLAENISLNGPPGVGPFPATAMATPPFLPTLPAGTVFQELGIPQSHMVDPGVYLEAGVPLSKRANLKGGLRYDAIFTASNPRLIYGNVILFGAVPGTIAPQTTLNPIVYSRNPNDLNLSRNFGLFSTYITGEYAIDEHLTALGGFGYAERPPTLVELYANGPFINYLQQGLTRVVGDPHLLPPALKQLDIGIKGNYQWFRGGVTGFYSWIDDYITFNQVTNVSPYNVVPNQLNGVPQGGSNTIVFTNTPRSTIGGGELYGQADVTKWLTPFGNLAYVQARDLTHNVNYQPTLVSSRTGSAQEPLPGIPPLQGFAGFRIHQARPTPNWSVEFSAQMVAGQNLVATSLDELESPGYTIYNIRAFWKITQATMLTGGVENLGDKFYRSHLDPRSGSPTDVLFQPGRNYYFGVQVTY